MKIYTHCIGCLFDTPSMQTDESPFRVHASANSGPGSGHLRPANAADGNPPEHGRPSFRSKACSNPRHISRYAAVRCEPEAGAFLGKTMGSA